MLKITVKLITLLKITPAVKGLFIIALVMIFSSFYTLKHPFYLSVVDIKQDATKQNLNVSVRLFTNDLEDALRKITAKPIDILNPKNKVETDSLVFNYIKKRLTIQVNSKADHLKFIGYEKEEESVWVYLEIQQCPKPKTIVVDTKLLYDYLLEQVNIVHAEINTIKKTSKVTNPDSRIEFSF